MDRRVYGSLQSIPTLKVLACIYEHDLDFEFVPIDMKAGEHKNKGFLAMSPFGQLPVYEEGGVKQFESRAIIRSMAHGHGKKGEELVYRDTMKQADVANWIDVEDHKFEPPALKLIMELLIKPMMELDTDETVVAEAEAELAKVLDVYEVRLGQSKYLGSDRYTVADLLHLPNLHSLMSTPVKQLFDSRPRVSAWCSDILARPAWARVLDMQKKAEAASARVC